MRAIARSCRLVVRFVPSMLARVDLRDALPVAFSSRIAPPRRSARALRLRSSVLSVAALDRLRAPDFLTAFPRSGATRPFGFVLLRLRFLA